MVAELTAEYMFDSSYLLGTDDIQKFDSGLPGGNPHGNPQHIILYLVPQCY